MGSESSRQSQSKWRKSAGLIWVVLSGAGVLAALTNVSADPWSAVAVVGGSVVVGLAFYLTSRESGGAREFVTAHGWESGGVSVGGGPDTMYGGGTTARRAWGQWRGWPAGRFRLVNPKDNEIFTQTWVEHVWLRGDLPAVTFVPQQVHARPPVLSADPTTLRRAFDRQWAVRTKHPELARDLLDRPLMSLLLAPQTPKIGIRILGGSIYVKRTKWWGSARGIEERLDLLVDVAETISAKVYRTHGTYWEDEYAWNAEDEDNGDEADAGSG